MRRRGDEGVGWGSGGVDLVCDLWSVSFVIKWGVGERVGGVGVFVLKD